MFKVIKKKLFALITGACNKSKGVETPKVVNKPVSDWRNQFPSFRQKRIRS